MAFVQHDRPGTVQLCCCAQVDVANYQVEESSEMSTACGSCHEVVSGGDGEQVQDIGPNTFEEKNSIRGGEVRENSTTD